MTSSSPSSRTPLLIAAVGIVAALIGALAAQWWWSKPPIALSAGTVLQPPRALPSFALVDQDGRPFASERLQGQWSLIFFGFTSCPDVCPTTLTTLASVDKSLADLPAAQRPQIVFVSVDAKRDTPQQVKAYTQFFNPRFVGVTGEQASLEAFARALGAPVAIQPVADGGYTVDHSAAVFIINPKGQWRAIFSGPHRTDTLAADLRLLITTDR